MIYFLSFLNKTYVLEESNSGLYSSERNAISQMLGFQQTTSEFCDPINISILDEEKFPDSENTEENFTSSCGEINTVKSERLKNDEITNLISSFKNSATTNVEDEDDLLALMDSVS